MALLMIPDKIQLSRQKTQEIQRSREAEAPTGSRRIQRVSQFAEKGSMGVCLGITAGAGTKDRTASLNKTDYKEITVQPPVPEACEG